MIIEQRTITKATCDVCKKSLYFKGNKEYGPDYGKLESHFGYGSKYDDFSAMVRGRSSNIVVCEKCWGKALKAIDIDPLNFR